MLVRIISSLKRVLTPSREYGHETREDGRTLLNNRQLKCQKKKLRS